MSLRFSIKTKMLIIFIAIKVIPLLIFGWIIYNDFTVFEERSSGVIDTFSLKAKGAVKTVGDSTMEDSIASFGESSRERVEGAAADLAFSIASFLYERDADVLAAAALSPDEKLYQSFLASKNKTVHHPFPMKLNAKGDEWILAESPPSLADLPVVQAQNEFNKNNFSYNQKSARGVEEVLPLYREMTFIDLTGREQVKVTTGNLLSQNLKDVSNPENTFVKAETYFEDLKTLQPGEVYVSEVIGAYVKTNILGPYTPLQARRLGVEFAPEKMAYAGKENPVGKTFQGIIRFATPVMKNSKKVGYVTLALDHTHIINFAATTTASSISTGISDPSSGNYAFLWDYKHRSIVHPRHHSIVGYDPDTGQPVLPLLSEELAEKWRQSGKPVNEFLQTVPQFFEQSHDKKISAVNKKQGMYGLDCRYLNIAPQCEGWKNVTEYGGFGSFNILWTGVYKLTAVASIPYHTGRYSAPRGFGYVTLGENMDDYYKFADRTTKNIHAQVETLGKNLRKQKEHSKNMLREYMEDAVMELVIATVSMIVIVILIALWLASDMAGRITSLIKGMQKFQQGDRESRLQVSSTDELGVLAKTFNEMADKVSIAVKDLSLAEKKYREIFENVEMGIFQSNTKEFLAVNPFMAKLFGYNSVDEFLTVNILLKNTQKDSPHLKSLHQLLLSKEGRSRTEISLVRQDGTEFIGMLSVRKEKDSFGEYFIEGIIQDITAKQKTLEAYEQAKTEAEAANRAKNNFLANMSHEVRTPMNAIIGMGHLALGTDLTSRQRDYISKICKSADYLMRIINDVLDFSKIETGGLPLTSAPFDLHEVFFEVNTFVQKAPMSGELELITDLDPHVPSHLIGDAKRITQLLVSLVDNALKFTEKGEILVRCGVHEQKDHVITLLFTVKDTGIGMNAEQLKKISRPFTQADGSSTRKYGGLGLGLTIVGYIVRQMKGRLDITSEEGKGTTVNVFLPVLLNKKIKSRKNHSDNSMHGMRVLVVDDNDTAQAVLVSLLKGLYFEPYTASSAEEALALLNDPAKKDLFDLLIIDDDMPGTSGTELCQMITKEKLSKAPRMLTIYEGEEDDLDKIAAFADVQRVIPKPVIGSALFDALMDIFGKNLFIRSEAEVYTFHGGKVLVADDNTTNQQIAQEIFTAAGLHVSLAKNGQKALDMLQEEDFDVVIMDIHMPMMDGIESSRLMRGLKDPVKSQVPIIGLTASVLPEDKKKALEAGMTEYLTKPYTAEDILAAIARYVDTAVQEKDEEAKLPHFILGMDITDGLAFYKSHGKYRAALAKFIQKYYDVGERLQGLLEQENMDQAKELISEVMDRATEIRAVALAASAMQALDEWGESTDKNFASSHILLKGLSGFWAALEADSLLKKEMEACFGTGELGQGGEEELRKLMHELEEPLKKRRPKPCQFILEKIEKKDWPLRYHQEIANLSVSLKKYRFADALKAWEKISALFSEP